MEQTQIVVTPKAFAEARALLDRTTAGELGGEPFVKAFRAHCERHGWDWFGLEPRRLFNWRAMSLFAAVGYSRYCAARRMQLHEAGCAFWIFHAGPDCSGEHRDLDGVTLSPRHEFWRHYAPPLGWGCGCYVLGANNERGAARLGGDATKPLPEWWNKIDPDTELRPGIQEPWGSEEEPDLALLLAAIAEGHVGPPE